MRTVGVSDKSSDREFHESKEGDQLSMVSKEENIHG